MPRDSNGNYTLPAGNPVVPQTIIEVDWANPTMQDIGNALSDSLSRSGLGGLTAPLKFPDGIRTAPGITWTNEPTSGWYRKATNSFWYSVDEEDIFGITDAGIALTPNKAATGFPFLPLAGGTMVGNLILNGPPTDEFSAATKRAKCSKCSTFSPGW